MKSRRTRERRSTRSTNSWEANATFWITIIRDNRDKYRAGLTDLAVLQAVRPVAGLRVLDAGCAEGYLSRTLASEGATVTGIDSSVSLIDAARAKNVDDGLPISFDVGSVYELPYSDDAFDLIVCHHVINDLQDPTEPIREFGRVLRGGGQLVMLMLHPCFYNKHTERGEDTNSTIAASYFECRNIKQHFEVDGLTSPAANVAWFRSLEYYTSQLASAGFVITALTEPHPTEEQLANDPWWRRSFTRPLFMLITAQQR